MEQFVGELEGVLGGARVNERRVDDELDVLEHQDLGNKVAVGEQRHKHCHQPDK